MKYEIIETGFSKIIKRTDEYGTESWIPIDESNSDYQAYLNKDNPDWGKDTIS